MVTFQNSRLVLMLLIVTLAFPISDISALESRNDFLILYGEAGPQRDTLIAQRYSMTIEGRCVDMNIVRTLNPDFKWFNYISIQDMPPSSERRTYYDNQAALDGIDPETFHMHYWDYTEVAIQGSTLVFPGLQNAVTYEDTVNSRVITYRKNRTRFLANLSSPNLRQYEKMWACEVISTLPYNHGVQSQVGYYDGIFWDNGSHCLYNTGSIVTGGQIAEHPTHANKNDIGCSGNNWWWDSCLKLFYQGIIDTFALSPQWAPDGRQKYSMPNNANAWTDDYAVADVGDFFFMEFFPYWLTRGLYLPTLYKRDSLSAANGVSLMYSPTNRLDVDNYEGTRTWSEGQLTNLCWFYICSSNLSYLYQQGGGYYHNPSANGPSNHPDYPDNWEEGVWCGAMDFDVGDRIETKYQVAGTGTDGRGYNYTIYSRQYQNAKVFLRPRGSYNEHVDDATAVNLPLGDIYRELLPDGGFGNATNSITLRNAEGRIMIPASGDTIPPASHGNLTAEPDDDPGTIRLTWIESGDDGYNGNASYNVIKYSTDIIDQDTWASALAVPNPPQPSTPGLTVEFVMDNLTEGQIYYIALQTYDEVGNSSGISNVPDTFACGILSPPPVGTYVDTTSGLAIAVSLVIESYYQGIYYEFAFDTLDYFPTETIYLGMLADTTVSATFGPLEESQNYFWRGRALASSPPDTSNWSETIEFNLYTTGIEDDSTEEEFLALDIHPYPNPFNSSQGHTNITFVDLPENSSITIATISGNIVTRASRIGPGEWVWDVKNEKGSDLASGIYLYNIEFPSGHRDGKVMIIR